MTSPARKSASFRNALTSPSLATEIGRGYPAENAGSRALLLVGRRVRVSGPPLEAPDEVTVAVQGASQRVAGRFFVRDAGPGAPHLSTPWASVRDHPVAGRTIRETVLAFREAGGVALEWALADDSQHPETTDPLRISFEVGPFDSPPRFRASGNRIAVRESGSEERVRLRLDGDLTVDLCAVGEDDDGHFLRIALTGHPAPDAPVGLSMVLGGIRLSPIERRALEQPHIEARVWRSRDGERDEHSLRFESDDPTWGEASWLRTRLELPPSLLPPTGTDQALACTALGLFDLARRELKAAAEDALGARALRALAEYTHASGDLSLVRARTDRLVEECTTAAEYADPQTWVTTAQRLADAVESVGDEDVAEAVRETKAGGGTELASAPQRASATIAAEAFYAERFADGVAALTTALGDAITTEDDATRAAASCALGYGALGLVPDAAVGRLTFAPVIPASTAYLKITGLRLADSVVHVTYARSEEAHQFVFEPQQGRVPIQLVFEPRFSSETLGTVTVNGEETDVEPEAIGDAVAVRLQLPIDAVHSVLIDRRS